MCHTDKTMTQLQVREECYENELRTNHSAEQCGDDIVVDGSELAGIERTSGGSGLLCSRSKY